MHSRPTRGPCFTKVCQSTLPEAHLDALVTVGTVVDDGERLLETGPPDADDIGNQLTDGNNHLRAETDRNQSDAWPARSRGVPHAWPRLPAGVFGRRTCVPCSQSCFSWGSRGDGRRRCGWSSAWSCSTWGFHSTERRTCRPGHRRRCKGTGERKRERERGSNAGFRKDDIQDKMSLSL